MKEVKKEWACIRCDKTMQKTTTKLYIPESAAPTIKEAPRGPYCQKCFSVVWMW